jgi:asparagine synthase (glutamine-hydrolysing)
VLGPLLAAATPGWARALVRRLRGVSPTDAARPPPFGPARRLRLISRPQLAHRLEIWAQTGARYGLAFAFPLLERRVVEYALSLPADLYLRGGFRRRLFRDAMEGVLPDLVRLRHQKFQPFPGSALVLADRQPELLARLEAYRAHQAVRAVVDLDLLRRQIEAFPPPERMREELRRGGNPTAPSAMIAVSQTLMVAEYLAQHGAPAGGDDGQDGPT